MPSSSLGWGRSSTAVFALVVVLGFGCDAEEGGESETEDGTEGETEGETETPAPEAIPDHPCDVSLGLSWENFGQGFILSQCAGCHSSELGEGMRAGAPLGVDFETQARTQQWLERIYARAAADTTMPPVDSVTASERELLGEWLACGAP